MPTPFPAHSSGQVIASADINLIQSAVVNLEKGAALYVVEATGSAANAYVASPAPGAPDPLTAGYHVRLLVANANTGASTLDVGATAGAVAITKRGGTALESGDLPAGLIADLVYDGTGWTLQNPQPGTGGGGFSGDHFEVSFLNSAGGSSWESVLGTWSRVAAAGFIGGETLMGPNTQNAAIRLQFFSVPSSGTWAIRLLGSLDTARGIATVQVDGSTVGTWDQYIAAGGGWNRWSSAIPLGSLTANTDLELKIIAATKHPSATSYVLSLNRMLVYRTA